MTKPPLIGTAGYKTEFSSHLPEGGLMVGVKVSTGRHGPGCKYGAVASIQPLYPTAKGIVAGKTHGPVKSDVKTLQAKDGYAVGGMKLTTGAGKIKSIQLVFMRINGRTLDPQDSHLSPAYREMVPDAPVWPMLILRNG